MNDLTELKEQKMQKNNEVLMRKQDTVFDQERVKSDIEKLRREKEFLVGRQQQYHKEEEDRNRKIEQLQIEIEKQ